MDEHRASIRRRTLKEGKLILSATSVLDCRIRDLSDTGARIDLGGITPLPPNFRLLIVASNLAYPAELKWQRGQIAGVHFTGPGEVPAGRV